MPAVLFRQFRPFRCLKMIMNIFYLNEDDRTRLNGHADQFWNCCPGNRNMCEQSEKTQKNLIMQQIFTNDEEAFQERRFFGFVVKPFCLQQNLPN